MKDEPLILRPPEGPPPEGAKRILCVAGEESGDKFAAKAIEEMLRLEPRTQFYGLGGSRMKEVGVAPLTDITKRLAIIGFSGVLRNYLPLHRLLSSVYESIDRDRPDAVFLTDYQGFNQRIAEYASERGVAVLYYVCPQFWAWNPRRKYKFARIVDLLCVIFRFEERLCREVEINAHYVGHPLLDFIKVTKTRDEVMGELGLDRDRFVLGMLPGSRRSEVVRMLPVMLEAAESLMLRFPEVQFVLPQADTVPRDLLEKYIARYDVPVKIVNRDRENVRAAMDFAWVTSGTATLETAILGTPHLILYKLNFLTWVIAQRLVQTPYIGLVNIVAEDRVLPELLQDDATAENVCDLTFAYLNDDEKMKKLHEALARVRERIGGAGAGRNVARLAMAYLNRSPEERKKKP